MRSGRRPSRLGLRVLVCLATVFVSFSPAAAAQETPKTYAGQPYSSELPLPPTRTENQSKIWFHADAWWGLLLESTGRSARVFELMPDHSWRPTSAVVNPDAGDLGDALHDGDTVHVVNRRRDGTLYYTRLTFDAGARDYRVAPPVVATTRGSSTSASIAKDTTGRLWVSYAEVNHVVVMHSDDGGTTWAESRSLASTGTGSTPELAALVSYDDRIGIMWSDQGANAFGFASHRDGDPPEAWVKERGPAGPAQADNHISLQRIDGEPSDTLVAAVKTSRGDQGEPADSVLIEVLIRAPDGDWSKVPVSTVADRLDDPVLVVDETTRTLHLFASGSGNIVTKRAPLDNIRFDAGLGNLFVLGPAGGLVDPTVPKESVDSRSGLVVLASDAGNRTYHHAEMALTPAKPVSDPEDKTPPTPPGALEGRALTPERVVLSWSDASDGDRWTPAREGVPVREYVVLRDGVEVATVSSTSVVDEPGARTDGAPVEYQVLAVDMSGNRSPAVDVVVDLPTPETSTETLVGVGLLVLAGCAGAFAFWRRRLTRGTVNGRPRAHAALARSRTRPIG
jgi:hypothetical protein